MTRLLPCAALLSCCLGLTGCPKPAVLGPLDFGPRGRLQDPSAALDAVMTRRDRVKTVRGEAKVAVEGPDGAFKVSEFIAACLPDHVRLETTSFFGNPIAVLTSDGTTFALHDIEHQKFLDGAATPENVSRLLPVRFRPEDIVSLLAGVPPLLVATDTVTLDVDEAERLYRLVLKRGGAVEVIGLEPATLRPIRVWMNDEAGITAYEAAFEDYDSTFDLPRKLRVTTRTPKTLLELQWRDREVNAELPVNIFRQTQPPGTASPTPGS